MSRLSLAVATLLAVGGCGDGADRASGDKSTEGPDPIRVEAQQVRQERFVHQVALTGTLLAEHSVLMKAEVEGVVESFEAEEGKPVQKGDVLFTLRDGEQQAKLREAQAELELARDTFKRNQRLSKKDISSQARQAEARAGLDSAKAKVALAEVELERTQVRAPFDGVLGSLVVSPGARLEERDGLITIEAIDKLQIVFTVQEIGVAIARVGAAVHLRVIAYPDQRFPGVVFYIAPSIDPATRRLILKAWVPNEEHLLKPGMFANVDIEVERKEDAMLIPESAMVYDRHGTYVWRIDENHKVTKIPVEIGRRQEGRIEIVSGLDAGDWIITAGTSKVLAGKRVDFSGAELPIGKPSGVAPPAATAHKNEGPAKASPATVGAES